MLQTILGAFASCAEGISIIILALGLGYTTLPTVIGFAAAAAGMLFYGQVVPLSIMSEQVVLIRDVTTDHRERQSIILFAGLIMALLGAFDIIGAIREFIGDTILSAMMAGVGILLARVSIDMIRKDAFLGSVSLAAAVIVYSLTGNLVYTVAACVAATTLVYNIFYRKKIRESERTATAKERFEFVRPKFSRTVVRGVLAFCALLLGEVIADAGITSSFADVACNYDGVAVYTGVANFLSGLLGGTPLGPIIAGTAAAPMPMISGILMMGILVLVLALKVIPRIARFIPTQGVAGFIFVVAVFVVLPDNAASAITAEPKAAAITMLITAFVDPFFGMCAGVAAHYLFLLLGI